MMNKFLIRPLPNEVSDELKETMRDQFGNEPQLETAQISMLFLLAGLCFLWGSRC